MTKITSTYQDNLRCVSTHKGNGQTLTTDAPLDNHGKGESFSPTDLLATSLITCMITVMAIGAVKNGIESFDAKGEVEKSMSNSPRKIKTLRGEIVVSGVENSKHQQKLSSIAINCPVALSLSKDVEQRIEITWD